MANIFVRAETGQDTVRYEIVDEGFTFVGNGKNPIDLRLPTWFEHPADDQPPIIGILFGLGGRLWARHDWTVFDEGGFILGQHIARQLDQRKLHT